MGQNVKEKLSNDDADLIASNVYDKFNAQLNLANRNAQSNVKKIYIDLSVARLDSNPFIISFPFKSFYIQDGTDGIALIEMKLYSRDLGYDSIKVRRQDSMVFGSAVNACYLSWASQTGKFLELIFAIDIEIKSGSTTTYSASGGGSTSTSILATVSVTTSETTIATASSRSKMVIYNEGVETVYLGSTGVTTATGIPLASGASYEHASAGVLVGITASGSCTVRRFDYV